MCFHTNTRTGVCEGHKLFRSENPWVSGWGLTGSRWMKKAKNMQQFQIGVRIPLA